MKKKVTLTFKGRKFVEVAEDLQIKYAGKIYTIPKGFKTDLASIPRPLWWFIAPTDWFILIPAIFHDWLYRYHILPRDESDFAFSIKMKDFDRKVVIRRHLARLAVRLFAGKIYKSYGK